MKNSLIHLTLLLGLISHSIFSQAQHDTLVKVKREVSFHTEEVNLTKGMQISRFNNDTASNRTEKGQLKIGSYDGTKFELHYTPEKIIVVNSEQKKDPFQNRIHIKAENIKASGSANEALIELWPSHPNNYWYLVKIGTMENKLDSIQGPLRIKLTATCVDTTLYPVIRMNNQGNTSEVFVLPHTTRTDRRYKKKHKKSEQAIFLIITITDSANNSCTLAQGNYFLMEGKEIYFNR